MPTIEITQEQAQALADGKDITIKPEGRYVYDALLVPSQPNVDWQHVYYVIRGFLRTDTNFLETLDSIHVIGRNGQVINSRSGDPSVLPGSRKYKTGLPIGEGKNDFKIAFEVGR